MSPFRLVVPLFLACSLYAQPTVIATGLQGPQRIILTQQGSFLVSETSVEANAGRISLVTRSGQRRSLIEGLPSGLDVADAGSGPTAMALRERTLYVAIGGGDAERRGEGGVAMYNPAGMSSALFTSILKFELSATPDQLATFRITPEIQQALISGFEADLQDGAGGTAKASLLVKFPEAIPDPNTRYRFSNPWGLELTADGRWLYLADASRNTLLRIDTASGRYQGLVTFPPIPNSTPVGPPMLDSVPTSVRLYGSQVLVSFLTGFPFTPGNARVLAVNPEARTTEPFIFGLNSATDVLPVPTAEGRTRFYVLEFSTNQSAQPPAAGRLLRYDTPQPQVLADDLNAAVSLAYDAASQELFILELTGRILRITQ